MGVAWIWRRLRVSANIGGRAPRGTRELRGQSQATQGMLAVAPARAALEWAGLRMHIGRTGRPRWREDAGAATTLDIPMPFCAMCEQPVKDWLPYPRPETVSPLMGLLEVVGSDMVRHNCPNCRCNDRERHIWLYLSAIGLLDEAIQRPILHIAPEPNIERKFRALARSDYVAGDLHPRHAHHARIDVENLDFPDGRFHLVMCNRVLEHVSDFRRAIRELARVLAPDGWLIAQTPYSALLRDTMEFTVPPSKDQAQLFFGQDDHVRLFGANIAEHFTACGLQGRLYPHRSVLPDIDASTCGCNALEPLFLFSKTRWLTSAS